MYIVEGHLSEIYCSWINQIRINQPWSSAMNPGFYPGGHGSFPLIRTIPCILGDNHTVIDRSGLKRIRINEISLYLTTRRHWSNVFGWLQVEQSPLYYKNNNYDTLNKRTNKMKHKIGNSVPRELFMEVEHTWVEEIKKIYINSGKRDFFKPLRVPTVVFWCSVLFHIQ